MEWQSQLTLTGERGLLHFQEFREPVDIFLVARNQPDDTTEINSSTNQDSSPGIVCEAFTSPSPVLLDVLEWEMYLNGVIQPWTAKRIEQTKMTA